MYYGIILENADDIQHYGVKRKSGRYPYGSGERPFQGEADSTGMKNYVKTVDNKLYGRIVNTDLYRNLTNKVFDVVAKQPNIVRIANSMGDRIFNTRIGQFGLQKSLQLSSEITGITPYDILDFEAIERDTGLTEYGLLCMLWKDY